VSRKEACLTGKLSYDAAGQKLGSEDANESMPEYRWNHYPQGDLRWAGDEGWMPHSQALLARQRGLSCIIFVHGWGGSSGSTWEQFPEGLATMPETARSDVFLIEYPTRAHTVAFCASRFRQFLFDVVRNPAEKVVNPSLAFGAPLRDAKEQYDRILMVAHSMGAVVARRALLDSSERAAPAERLTDDELRRIRMLFFAPAHCGSRIALLLGSGLGLDNLPGAKLLGAILTLWMRSVPDLEEESPTLKRLAEDAANEIRGRESRNASTEHICARVYHAEDDRVVVQNDFFCDYPFKPVMDRNHRTICKPLKGYRTPIEALSALFVDEQGKA
jgi:pimeloyl-ACP methyl ester carboxylesterase